MSARQTAAPELSQLLPPASLLSPAPSTAASPAPPGCVTPPLSEPDQRAEAAPSGGSLKFFGRDGRVVLELSHPPATYERRSGWTGVSRNTFWPSSTVAAPVDNIAARSCSAQSEASCSQCSPSPRKRQRCRKLSTPRRSPPGDATCLLISSRAAAPAAAVLLRQLGRRPLADMMPASPLKSTGVCRRRPLREPALSSEARSACLVSVIRRIWDRHPRGSVSCDKAKSTNTTARVVSPRKRPLSTGEKCSLPRPRPTTVTDHPPAVTVVSGGERRPASVHSIDSLLSRSTVPSRPPASIATRPGDVASSSQMVEPPPLSPWLAAGSWQFGYRCPYPAYPLYAPYAGLAAYLRGEMGVVEVQGAAPVGTRRAQVRRPTPLLPGQAAACQPRPAHGATLYGSAHRREDSASTADERWLGSTQNDFPLNLSKR